ncbi:MAG: endonuclease/exonuclease/phosphatase family protein [Eudoraea sp.]|nr:endonuclease/exonuclease/phosphatase family protein [Eudoraea sp.]NNK30928.1 endonuclease/exonuclease/phosphatase family protein [Flavobacteriaceae bacterium]
MNRNTGLTRLLLILNIFPALILGLVCVIAYYPIDPLPLLDVLGLITPVLVSVNLMFLLYWGFQRRWYVLVPFIPLLIGFLSFGSIYQINTQSNDAHFDKEISILSYNVKGFSSYNRHDSPNIVDDKIIEFVKEQDPDIICFQEFSWIRARQVSHYPFKYWTPFSSKRVKQAIFSKFPIVGNGSLDLPNTSNNAIYADIVYEKDTLRVYNIHLESYWIRSFRSLLKKNAGVDFLKRLQYTASKHREQARILQGHREKSPYPSIFCGDFNQTPYSPSYKILNSGMQDSFRERGQGWGTTFIRNIISARIDFILADSKAFEVLEHRNFDLRASDHLPVMARLDLKSDQ